MSAARRIARRRRSAAGFARLHLCRPVLHPTSSGRLFASRVSREAAWPAVGRCRSSCRATLTATLVLIMSRRSSRKGLAGLCTSCSAIPRRTSPFREGAGCVGAHCGGDEPFGLVMVAGCVWATLTPSVARSTAPSAMSSETMSSTMSAGIAKAADLVKVTRPAGDDRGCRHDSGCQGDDLVAQALRALDRRASTPMGSSASAREVCPSYGSGRVPVPSGGSLMPIPLRYGVCARIRRHR